MRRKSKADWSMIEEAIADILAICAPPRDLTYAIHQDAARLAAAHHLPIYDATIIAAAIEAGCDMLWSEDLQDGRCFGGLTVRNPFAAE